MMITTKPMFVIVRKDVLGVFNSRVSLGLPFGYFNYYIPRPFSYNRGLKTTNKSAKHSNSIPVLFKNSGVICNTRLGGSGLSLFRPTDFILRCFNGQFMNPFIQGFSIESRLLSLSLLSFEQRRYRTSKKTPKRPEYDSDSDTDDEEPIQGTKVLTVRLQSLRTDGVLKKALSVARNKVEVAFYEGHIRINGQKPTKKSHQLQIGDEIDLIRGVSPVNPDLLSVSRVEILSVQENDESDQLSVKVRRTKTLYIENYSTDPWKKGSTEQNI